MPRVVVNTMLEGFIGGQIASCRRKKGISQKGLAATLKITSQQMHKYEKGINRLPASTLMILCKKLEVSPAFFFSSWDESFKQHNALIESYQKLDPRRKVNALRLMKDMQPAGEPG